MNFFTGFTDELVKLATASRNILRYTRHLENRIKAMEAASQKNIGDLVSNPTWSDSLRKTVSVRADKIYKKRDRLRKLQNRLFNRMPEDRVQEFVDRTSAAERRAVRRKAR